MKKTILFLLLLIFSITNFSASELDSLLKDDGDLFDELTADENGLLPKDAYVEELFGQVYLQHEGSDKWLQLIKNSTVEEKDTVLTMENSGVKIRIEDETYINLNARSKIYFDTMRGKPNVELMTETGLKLAWGKVFSKVRKKLETGGRYEIEVEGVVAGVRGTQYEVEKDKETKKIKIKVFEGKVVVTSTEKKNQKKSVGKKSEKEEKKTDKSGDEENQSSSNDQSEDSQQADAQEQQGQDSGDEGLTNDDKQNLDEGVSLGPEDELNIGEDGVEINITKHDDEAPTELEKSSAVSSEIQKVANDVTESDEETQGNQSSSTSQSSSEEQGEEEEFEDDEMTEEVEEETLQDEVIQDKIPEDEVDEVEDTVEDTVDEVVDENTSVGKIILEIK